MENNNIKVEINVEMSCPKCDNGHLLPFLRPIYKRTSVYGEGRNPIFDHYEIYYRCDHCNFQLEGDSYL